MFQLSKNEYAIFIKYSMIWYKKTLDMQKDKITIDFIVKLPK